MRKVVDMFPAPKAQALPPGEMPPMPVELLGDLKDRIADLEERNRVLTETHTVLAAEFATYAERCNQVAAARVREFAAEFPQSGLIRRYLMEAARLVQECP